MKLAIVVGHSARAQGAVRADTNETEFVWNSRLAEMIKQEADGMPNCEVGVFFRRYTGSTRRELRDVYRRADIWGADASVELHFNSHHNPGAKGTETLTSGTRASLRFAEAAQDRMLDALGLKDRGEKIVRSGRGAQSLISGKAPAILLEPFFGSSPGDLRATDQDHEMRGLARAVLLAFEDAFL